MNSVLGHLLAWTRNMGVMVGGGVADAAREGQAATRQQPLFVVPSVIEVGVPTLVASVFVVVAVQVSIVWYLYARKPAAAANLADKGSPPRVTSRLSGKYSDGNLSSSDTSPLRNDHGNGHSSNGHSSNGHHSSKSSLDVSSDVILRNGKAAFRGKDEQQVFLTKSKSGNLAYRIQEEGARKMSSEYTRRGQLWSKHASWHLPTAPRLSLQITERQLLHQSQGLEHVTAILNKFEVCPRRGFLPSQDPLQRLPYARYHLWEDLGDDLPKLLGARLGQARDPLKQLPVLATDKLVTDAELRRAHLLLCLFAHAYVWGGPTPLDTIPEGIAKPLSEVSERLNMPPALGHASIVLYNWRRLDAGADICMENLSTLNNFFDGRDESWFYLIHVEIEARGAASIVPIMLSIDAIQRYNEEQQHRRNRRTSRAMSNLSHTSDECGRSADDAPDGHGEYGSPYDRRLMSNDVDEDDPAVGAERGFPHDEEALVGELTPARVAEYVAVQLNKVAKGIRAMVDSLTAMREGCHPFIFYHRVRPFLSAWRDNPSLPDGVVYEGVSDERHRYYGGSAAQSSLIPFLDIALGVSHQSSKSQDFLRSMRAYMPRPHREFLGYMESVACVREFVVEALKSQGIGPDTPSDVRADRAAANSLPPSVSFSSAPPTAIPPAAAVSDLVGTPQSPAATYWAAQAQAQQAQAQQAQELSDQEAAAAAAAAHAAAAPAPSEPATVFSPEAEARRERERQVWLNLRDAYDACIEQLQSFRTAHISLVADYILAQQKVGANGRPVSRAPSSDNLEGSAGGKGTGGTDLMKFLKPIRDNCGQSLLAPPVLRPGVDGPDTAFERNLASARETAAALVAATAAAEAEAAAEAAAVVVVAEEALDNEPYKKDNGCFEDIDLYRGAAYPTGRMMYTIPVDRGWDVVTQTPIGGGVGSFSYQYQ